MTWSKTKAMGAFLLGALLSVALMGRASAEEAKLVGKATCANCHGDLVEAFSKTFHGRKTMSDPKLANSCEACHGAGSAHVDAGGDKSKIIAPKGMDAAGQAAFCLKCHNDKALMMWKTGAHANNNVGCLTCHSVHHGEGRQSLAKGNTEICMTCHTKQKADMRLPSHHPVPEGKMSCVSCHNPHGGVSGNLKADSEEELCAKCHSEKVGPFAFEHPPVSDGCNNCHVVHGSSTQRLLKQDMPYLCLGCHKWPHQSRPSSSDALGVTVKPSMTVKALLQRGRCTDCHREIHGSDNKSAFKD